ncbi:MFS transporter [Geminicoccaceae bacterium 1502E]|nr:MFS transporter [Geminicoccaceae bacterium 1502E]
MTVSQPFWRTSGIVILAGCLIALVSFGARSGFGLFLGPMSEANAWGREVFAVAIGIQNLLWGVGQMITGAIADRFGATRVLVVGALVYCAGLLLMAVAASPLVLHLSAGVLVGIGGAGASFAIVMAAVARMVPEERRSWALGVIVASSSLGMFLFAPMTQGLILAYGWSTALVVVACLVLLVVPLALPYAGQPASASAAGQSIGQAIREAAGHRSYWYLVTGFFVCGYHVAFIQTHLPAYITDSFVAPWVAGWAIALVGLFNVVGSYASGVLGGRYSKKNLLSLIYVLRALVIALYVLLPVTATTTLVFAAAMGLLWLSTVPLTSGLVAVMFGPRYMAMLFGVVFFSHQLGAFLGVWLGGRLYDVTGSYDVVWWIGVALGLLAALIHLPITERPVVRTAAA